jgi:hypothetical protein
MADVSTRDPVLPATRWVAIAIVPFLVVAGVGLYPWPASTGGWFAWAIHPTMATMVLAAAYLGGAWFFVQVATTAHWRDVRGGFPPVVLFATTLGVATIVHWDRFERGHVAFWIWAGLYFTTPFIVSGVAIANEVVARGAPARGGPAVPTATRAVAALAGVGSVALGLWCELWPGAAADAWPWALSPLTARVVGAVLMLGVAGVVVALDPARSAVRVLARVAAVMLGLDLLAAARAHGELDDRPLGWCLLAAVAAGFAATVAFEVAERRRRHAVT